MSITQTLVDILSVEGMIDHVRHINHTLGSTLRKVSYQLFNTIWTG